MTREPTNSHMFFAYHIRSAFLICERALREMLDEKDISPEHFYILQCDWKSQETALETIRAHAILSAKEAIQSVNDLMAKGYVIKGSKEGFYALSSKGSMLRNQLLETYRKHISKATEGLSEKTIENALSSLLTVQNNLQLI